jgi:UDP-N-acetylglucosamine acyltransferase
MQAAIHPTAIVHPDATIHPTATVGPYTVIGAAVTIGADTHIGPHVTIDGHTTIGERNHIFPGAAIGTEPQDRKYQGAPSQTIIGNDNKIREYVTINRATAEGEVTQIGDGNLLMACSHVAHNCTIEDNVVIANGVALAGHVTIESRATIGGVLGVHQFVRIGRLAMVGGMSRIDRDVPPFMLVEGSPGRVRTLNRVGLQRAGYDELDGGLTTQTLNKAFRILYRSDETLDRALAELLLLPQCEALQHLIQFLETSKAGRRGPMVGRKRRSSHD